MVESAATELEYALSNEVHHYFTPKRYVYIYSFFLKSSTEIITKILSFTATKYFQQLRFITRLMVLLGIYNLWCKFLHQQQ